MPTTSLAVSGHVAIPTRLSFFAVLVPLSPAHRRRHRSGEVAFFLFFSQARTDPSHPEEWRDGIWDFLFWGSRSALQRAAWAFPLVTANICQAPRNDLGPGACWKSPSICFFLTAHTAVVSYLVDHEIYLFLANSTHPRLTMSWIIILRSPLAFGTCQVDTVSGHHLTVVTLDDIALKSLFYTPRPRRACYQ